MPLKKPEPGARGTIWSEGIHHVWVDRKPARVRVPQYTIPETYQQFKDQITEDGGIQIGIDHIPEELLVQYPILKKLDPLNVGRITGVETDGSKIYATKSEHTNPLIAELYSTGELTSYSVVAPMFADVDEGEDADYVFNKFKSIKRMDYVDEGGCTACKVDALPDDLILTAKLSMEVDNLTKEEKTINDSQEQEIESSEPVETEDKEVVETKTEEQQEEEVMESVEPEYVTREVFNDAIGELKELLTTQPETSEMEARLAEMEVKAARAEIKSKIEYKVKEGTIKPAQVDGLLEAGLAMKPEDFDKHLATFTDKIVDLKQHSIHAGKSEEEEEYTFKTYQKRREAGY